MNCHTRTQHNAYYFGGECAHLFAFALTQRRNQDINRTTESQQKGAVACAVFGILVISLQLMCVCARIFANAVSAKPEAIEFVSTESKPQSKSFSFAYALVRLVWFGSCE